MLGHFEGVTGTFWARKRVPIPQALPTLFLLSKVLRFFISKPIVVELCTQIGDNIIHNRIVSD